jgi:ribonuclease HII
MDYNRKMILGIDEVGRGPWAGPLVVGAVVLGGTPIEGLTDSKALSKKRREALDAIIRQNALAVGLGWVNAAELDEIGMSAALRLATRRAVAEITVPYHEIIIDGRDNFLDDTNKGQYVTTLVKADLLIPSVSAASIVAKVARDNYMREQAAIYPEYGFDAHAGYGVKKHREAIDVFGVTPLHRLSFAPLKKFQQTDATELGKEVEALSTPRIGDLAESIAADYLYTQGHEVVARNWRTKWCEIDIITIKDDCYYFVEVKYRKSASHGDGMAAITPRKVKQMTFAAKLFMAHRPESDMRLAAISLFGVPPQIDNYLDL